MKIGHIAFGILGISLVIGIHEMGHWTMCHLFGVATHTVSIGIGPSIADFHIGTTQFSIGILPLGGYVEMLGSRLPVAGFEKISFASQPLFSKMCIILGGILFNLLFGFLTIACIRRRKGDHSSVEKNTDNEEISKNNLIGPIGIIRLLVQSANRGWRYFSFILGILSINLGLFNLIPLPPLDGGQLVLSVYESLTGTMLSDLTYDVLSLITIIIFGALLIYTTGRDIRTFRNFRKQS